MKRIVALLLTLVLLVPAAVFAEEVAGETSAPFTIRSGIRWGMSIEEVKATEWADADVDVYENEDIFTTLNVEEVRISNQTARMSALFISDQLVGIEYMVGEKEEVSVAYLKSALESKYGAFSDGHEQYLADLLNIINMSDENSADDLDRTSMVQLADDTVIFWAYDNSYLSIVYIAEPLLEELRGVYDTYGL